MDTALPFEMQRLRSRTTLASRSLASAGTRGTVPCSLQVSRCQRLERCALPLLHNRLVWLYQPASRLLVVVSALHLAAHGSPCQPSRPSRAACIGRGRHVTKSVDSSTQVLHPEASREMELELQNLECPRRAGCVMASSGICCQHLRARTRGMGDGEPLELAREELRPIAGHRET